MLQVTQIVKHFGGVRAVDGVSFTVAPGECVALIGPNGAGKSTCFACIAGQHTIASGQIVWNGASIAGLPAAARLRLGVARTFQVAQVFDALTVLENVQLAIVAAARSGRFALSAFRKMGAQSPAAAHALLAKTVLDNLAAADAASLPYGARKRLELAIALAAQPQLLLLDEPAAGLALPERQALMTLIKSLAQQGMAVLYTEHNMDAVQNVADRVLVLLQGRLAAAGSFDEIARDPVVQKQYLGSGTSHA
jgi:branched-chain amino acid transport system ATP-binding protein